MFVWVDWSIGSVQELLVLKNVAECTSQRLKWTSGARVMIIFGPSVFVARSLGRSVARSLDRSIARTLDRSIARSLDRTIARSVARSLARSLVRSMSGNVHNTMLQDRFLKEVKQERLDAQTLLYCLDDAIQNHNPCRFTQKRWFSRSLRNVSLLRLKDVN